MQEDDLNSECDTGVDSDSRWKSRKSTAKRFKPKHFEDYINDEEIERLLGPEEGYRDTTAEDIDPEDENLLNEDDSNSNMAMSDMDRLNDYTLSSQRLEPDIHSQALASISIEQSLDCNTSEPREKEESLDLSISEQEREQVIGSGADEESEDETQLHSSRFKSERKVISANPKYEYNEKDPHNMDGGQVRANNQQRHQQRSYQYKRHQRRLKGEDNHYRPPQGYKSHHTHRPHAHQPWSPPLLHRPPPQYGWSPPHHYARSPPHHYARSPPHQRPPSPDDYHHHRHHPPPHHEYHRPHYKPPPLVDRRPPVYPPPMTDRREPPPPPRPREAERPPWLVERHFSSRPDRLRLPSSSDRAHYPSIPDRPRPSHSHIHPQFHGPDGQTEPLQDFPSRRDQSYERSGKDYEYSSYDNYSSDYHHYPGHDHLTDREYMDSRMEPQKRISPPPEQLHRKAPIPLFEKPQSLFQSITTQDQVQPSQHAQAQPSQHEDAPMTSVSHEVPESSFQLTSRLVSSSAMPSKEEFNFNLAAARQKVEAMQSVGKGNPFLKSQFLTMEPKTAVVKPVVRQLEPQTLQERQPVFKTTSLLPSTSCPNPQSKNPFSVGLLARQMSLDSALAVANPPAKLQNRHFSLDTANTAAKDIPPLFGPRQPLMEIIACPPAKQQSRQLLGDITTRDTPPVVCPRQALMDIKIPPELVSRSAASMSSEPNMMSLPAAKSVVNQKISPFAAMGQKSNATLVISEVPLGTSEGHLRKLFEEVGAIKQLILLPDENKAVVTYCDPRDALGCRRKFHRSPVNGSLISVSFK